MSASWSTTAPRAVLTRIAVGFMRVERGGVDQVARARRERDVQRDEVGLREQLGSGVPPRPRRAATSHVEARGAARDRLADAPGADDPQRRAGDVVAEEAVAAPTCPTRRA